MKAATVAEIIIAVLVGVGIIIWLVRRNVKDVSNANPNLSEAVKDQTKDQIHEEDLEKDKEPPSTKA